MDGGGEILNTKDEKKNEELDINNGITARAVAGGVHPSALPFLYYISLVGNKRKRAVLCLRTVHFQPLHGSKQTRFKNMRRKTKQFD